MLRLLPTTESKPPHGVSGWYLVECSSGWSYVHWLALEAWGVEGLLGGQATATPGDHQGVANHSLGLLLSGAPESPPLPYPAMRISQRVTMVSWQRYPDALDCHPATTAAVLGGGTLYLGRLLRCECCRHPALPESVPDPGELTLGVQCSPLTAPEWTGCL